MISLGPVGHDDTTDDAVYAALREKARERGAAIEAMQLASCRFDAVEVDDEDEHRLPPPPPKHAPNDPFHAKRVAEVARQLGLHPTTPRAAVIEAIESLSRRELRDELRRRLSVSRESL